MPDYQYRNVTDTNIRDLLKVNYTADAEVVAIIGTVGTNATAEAVGTVTALGNGEYDVTTTGTATSMIFNFGAGKQSLVPAP